VTVSVATYFFGIARGEAPLARLAGGAA